MAKSICSHRGLNFKCPLLKGIVYLLLSVHIILTLLVKVENRLKGKTSHGTLNRIWCQLFPIHVQGRAIGSKSANQHNCLFGYIAPLFCSCSADLLVKEVM